MRDYIEKLLQRGEMNIVEKEVDPEFELAAVIGRSQQESENPVLFKNVKGCGLPVISNLYGSHSRLCELIGTRKGNFCRHWQSIINDQLPKPNEYTQIISSKDGHVDGKISDLPPITYCERDAGPYITAGVFLAKEPDTGVPNLSFCRSMMVSDDELRVRLAPPHDITQYQKKAEARNQPLEVAILIGPPPEVFMAACASVPIEQDELAIAARLMGSPVPMRPCRHIDMQVPAETEIVIEGRILPHERRPEGPFGEFQGYYVKQADNHVFEVLNVSWREGACFHGLLCGYMEDLRALEVSFATRVYRQISAGVPGILDVSCYPTPMHTIVQIRPEYEGHARHVMLKVFSSHLQYNKVCIVVDEDVDIHDFEDVWWAVMTRGRIDKDIMTLPGVPGFFRDPAGVYTGRLGIDATKPFDMRGNFERKRVPGLPEINLKDYFT
jgi:4-hydroxybenzoate decarboxylase